MNKIREAYAKWLSLKESTKYMVVEMTLITVVSAVLWGWLI